jgi:hypothetical protein
MRPAYQRLKLDFSPDGGTIELEERQVAQLEQKYGVRLPDEFREYLLHACPKNDYCMDDNATDWWRLERIKGIAEENEHPIGNPVIARLAPTSLFFADWAVWCMAWAIVCESGEHYGRVVVFNVDERFVADSFGQFVDLYMQDFRQLM